MMAMVMLMGSAPVSGSLRMAWNDANNLRMALGEQEV
jgi:hypothetical protein